MNNPYRARPTRSRVDHSAAYGIHDQNMWAPVPRPQSDVPPNDTTQQPLVMNQSKHAINAWKDPWDWNLDQQSDTQQQQQQQRYVPSYTNQGQLISNSVHQDQYYKDLNGDMPDVLNQNAVSGRSTPRSETARQSATTYMDSFSPYPNYNQNQQYSSQRNTAKSSYEHLQWPVEQQLPQNTTYTQQRHMPSQNQKDQTPPVIHPPVSVPAHNYNWSKDDSANLTPQYNWQNHTDVLAAWQDSTTTPKDMQHVDNMDNQCVQSPPQMYNASIDRVNKEHSMSWDGQQGVTTEANNRSNDPPSQWHSQNLETATVSQQSSHPVQKSNIDDSFSSWSQQSQGNINASHDWRHANAQSDVHRSQWLQQTDNNSFKDNVSQENNGAARFAANEWQVSQQQIHAAAPPFQYVTVPAIPTTVDCTVHTSNNNEQHENEKQAVVVPVASTTSAHDTIDHAKLNDAKSPIGNYHSPNAMTDDVLKSDTSSKNVLISENEDHVFTFAITEELTSNLNQLNLGSKTSKQADHSHESLEAHSNSMEERGHLQSATTSNITSIRKNNSVPENIPVLSSTYAPSNVENSRSIESPPVVTQDHLIPNTYQSGAITKMTDSVSQSGYDQWYNQSALPTSSENAWYTKDHSRPLKQWSAEQNVENYENIQQTSDFVNVEVVAPATLQERDIYGSRDSINKETLDNDPKQSVEVPSLQVRSHPSLQQEQMPDNYEFASNDRNTFLETGELTDSHQEHEPTPPSQDDENDEVPNDIPFLREVPGQSSTIDPRRNDPTGQEQYVQTAQRLSDPRRNDPSGQEQSMQIRNISDRVERRDVPPGRERSVPLLLRGDSDTLERRNDPSGRERSLPPQQSRNDPSGEERYQLQSQIMLEPSETREVPGRGNESEEATQQTNTELRQIPGGMSSNVVQLSDDRTGGRVVTGSQEVVPPTMLAVQQDQVNDSRSKREEAVGASLGENQGVTGSSNRRDSYEDEDDERSGSSRTAERGDGKVAVLIYDRDREDDLLCYLRNYYDRRRAVDGDRQFNARDDFERRDVSYRDDDRKHHSRDDLDRHAREDTDRRVRGKDDLDERDGRRRPDDRRRDRGDDLHRRDRDPRDYDPRYPRDPRTDMRDSYRREYYDDPYGRSSRPSSRSSYNDRDREYYMRARDPYYAYNGYGGYDYVTYYYAYLENLRRTNPAAYSKWYHKYYGSQHQQQHIVRGVNNYPEDRASVHSGRSSCDDRTGDKRTLGDVSLLEDSAITSAHLTPTKYSTSHAYGCFSVGSLVYVHPSYPADGERAKVDIFRIDNLLFHDPITRDLRSHPGPLINGVTNKMTIIEYCKNKIRNVMDEEMVDRSSYILLYELMIMLIQQNGNVVGVDIATLLLRNKDIYPYDPSKFKSQDEGRRESLISQRSGATGGDGSSQDISTLSEKTETKQHKTTKQMTDEFRNMLLYGLVQEALEYAMNEGLWVHAIFLASKLDKRTYASVTTRFENSLPSHDPLQTLYQLHSGHVPAIVTCVADPRWDDWRPHLAMIISNASASPEISRRSITALGDTLFARGDIHAAHFCYILAQIEFGIYGANGVKLVLIGANHNKLYSEFLTTEAVMLTEIYEYARKLSDPYFTLVGLQKFKFDLAVKMVDYGLIEKALLYIEQIATNIANNASKYKRSFIEAVYVLGDRLKYHDPICKNSIEDVTNLIWLNKLAEIVGKHQDEEAIDDEAHSSHIDSRANIQNPEVHEINPQQQQQLPPPPTSQQQWNATQTEYGDGSTSMIEVNTNEMQSDWQPQPTNIQDMYDPNAQYMRNADESTQYQQPHQDYQQSYYPSSYGRNEPTLSNWQQQATSNLTDQAEIDNTQQQDKWNYEAEREDKTPTPELRQPTISMTPSMGKQYDPLEELDALETRTNVKPASEMKKTTEKTANSGGSWNKIGEFISKLVPKPKNQMKLPDDSNPSIVWDPDVNAWIDKNKVGDSGAATLAPPPKVSDVSFRTPTMEQASQPPPLLSMHSEDTPTIDTPKSVASSNGYKIPKDGRKHPRYVNILNPGGSKSSTASSNMPTSVTSPLVPMATSSPQLFVPTPINDPTAPVDFLTPATTLIASPENIAENASQTLSRWSSTSSLSREVQSYTMKDPRLLQRNKGPMMFNLSDMKDRSVKNIPSSRYPPR